SAFPLARSRRPPSSPLLPYTTLFRSHRGDYADGEQRRNFIDVTDCTRAMLWLMEARPQSGLFNLGTGKARSFKDLMLATGKALRSEEHTSELQSRSDLVCRLLLEKKK